MSKPKVPNTDEHPLAVNVLKFQRYTAFFMCDERVLFEYFVVKQISFGIGKSFYHSSETICTETGLKKDRLHSILKRFEELGVIDMEVKGFPKVKHFKVDFNRICFLINRIYQLTESRKLLADFRKLLEESRKPLAENSQQKNNKENTNSLLTEIVEGDGDWERSLLLYNSCINEIKEENNLPDISVTVDQLQLYWAAKNYGVDNVLEYLKRYFNNVGRAGTLEEFFKPSKADPHKLEYIEGCHVADAEKVTRFIQDLTAVHNERREMASDGQRIFRPSPLRVNKSIRNRINELLRTKSEDYVLNAFIAYCDKVLAKELNPKAFLPYFLKRESGDYPVIDAMLDYFNVSGYAATNDE